MQAPLMVQVLVTATQVKEESPSAVTIFVNMCAGYMARISRQVVATRFVFIVLVVTNTLQVTLHLTMQVEEASASAATIFVNMCARNTARLLCRGVRSRFAFIVPVLTKTISSAPLRH